MTIRALSVGLLTLCACRAPSGDDSDRGDADSDPTLADTDGHTDEPDTDAPLGPKRLDLGFVPRNLVIVNVDTLRADRLQAYGGPHDTLPRLTARGHWLVVDGAISTGSWTAPSVASLFSGLDLHEHGVRYFDGDSGVINADLERPTFPDHLNAQGLTTGMFGGNGLLPNPGFAKGFEVNELSLVEPGNADSSLPAIRAWLEAVPAEEPFLLYFQPMDAHGPYLAMPEDEGTWSDPERVPFETERGEYVQEQQIIEAVEGAADPAARDEALAQILAVYDEQLLGLDRAVDALLSDLEATGRLADTLVVFMADHGETFYDGDPEYVGHGKSTRQELVRVPLMFYNPALKAERVHCLASNMDVFPTLLAKMGLEPLRDVEGTDLAAGCREVTFSSVYEGRGGSALLTGISAHSRTTQVVVDCQTREIVAYDLIADPGAKNPLPYASVADGAALRAHLEARVLEIAATAPDTACDLGAD